MNISQLAPRLSDTISPRLIAAWNDFWFRPASPAGVVAVRFIIAANALWILLSRPTLPSLFSWPDAFHARIDLFLRIRYAFFLVPPAVEWTLFVLLHVALLCAMFGIRPRASCFVAGILLYHFAPVENMLWYLMGPYFSGLTLPVVALLVLAFAEPPGAAGARSSEYRWPVALIQIIFAGNYFFAAISKARTAGLGWVSADNVRGMAMASLTLETPPPLAERIAASPAACWTIAIVTIVVEWLFILVPFSRIAAAILVPVAFVGHIGIVFVLGIVFLAMPCLLIYVDWEWLADRVPLTRRSSPAAAEASA
jgi:hypothetical protein